MSKKEVKFHKNKYKKINKNRENRENFREI
jgi:hypothetical protein